MPVERNTGAPGHDGRWDHLISRLHDLRERSGSPSYAAIAQLVVDQRLADGQDVHSARIARSSVHDAFRYGRTRINVQLVRELVRALGEDPAVVDTWVQESLRPREDAPAPEPPLAAEDGPQAPPRGQLALLILGCLAVNLAGREFVDFFELPVYLDMVGTAIAAIALGPWRGAGVGAATNIAGIIGSGWDSLPFGLVNVAGALVWGYGVRRWRLGRTLPRFFGLNIITALVCSIIAVPVIVAVYGHDLRSGHDVITNLVDDSIDSFLVALGFSNMLTSLSDKLISGFVALVAVSALPAALRRDVDLVAVSAASTDTD
ncbi:hypothetical protein [Nocardioides sp.]|uniref:hypothetical protein n=1 Tax=Nocardioides sp. TaxID=35761 RepID=UPI0025D3D7B2|nr:hypothetical protein [Nocardioides sp.]